MIVLKLICPVLLLSIGLLESALAHRREWRDHRTTKNRRGRRFRMVLMFLIAAAALALAYDDHRSIATTQQRLDDLRERAEQQIRDARQSESAAVAHREELQARLAALDEKLKPFVEIATSRFPDANGEGEALNKLAQELGRVSDRTSRLEQKDLADTVKATYQPPTATLRAAVIGRLRHVLQQHTELTVLLVCEMGVTDRVSVARDLLGILKEAGIPARLSTTQTFYRSPPPPIRAVFNPQDEVLFHDFLAALAGYLGGTINRVRKDESDRALLTLELNGMPRFFPNSGVELR